MAAKLSIAIVGLPNVGKSTLFKALTKQQILIANYPFATIDPNVGVVAVPDERLKKLTDLSKSKKTIPAVVEFYDIAGLVKGASTGEGLGNQFLTHIRETQAIVLVLRVFTSGEIMHVEGSVDPVRDFEIITAELGLKDMETVDKRLNSLEKEARTGDKIAVKNFEVLKKVKEVLSTGKMLQEFADEDIMRELQLLTAKRILVMLNGAEADVSDALRKKLEETKLEYVVADLSKDESVPKLIEKAYAVLGLISFFTTGEDETRAWTIRCGSKAPQAAGVIHTDFEKNFIRAEVVACDKLLESGGWSKAKQKGLLRVEGKEYVVQDGDVMEIRHG
ncbi:MAG: redox-regulated ATPase YchF [bacterium]|nr:redox-regulated ATPase YchF [bacterium]